MADKETKAAEEVITSKKIVEDEKPVAADAAAVEAAKEADNAADTEEAESKDDAGEDSDSKAKDENGATDDDNTSKLERRIIRQVEYYFGDANLNRDKFLLEQISKDEEGWVPFSVLLTFKRLAALSNDVDTIVEALLKSDEGLLELSEDRKKVRRHPERPIPEHNDERRKEIQSRTAYAKGFPLDTDMSELIEFFTPYEKVLNINMRKYLDKPTKTYKFKGSVFVTFAKPEQTREFIEKDKVLFNERELLRKWQEKYLEEKKEEIKNKASKKKSKSAEEDKFELPKGTVLFFEGATEEVTRELLREAVDKMKGSWDIAYIDFSKGDKDGHIRFQEENIAAKFLDILDDKKLKLKGDVELTLRTLTEEEEKVFLQKAVEQMRNRRNQQHKHKGGHGHGHGNRKRRGGGGEKNDEKKKKVEAE